MLALFVFFALVWYNSLYIVKAQKPVGGEIGGESEFQTLENASSVLSSGETANGSI